MRNSLGFYSKHGCGCPRKYYQAIPCRPCRQTGIPQANIHRLLIYNDKTIRRAGRQAYHRPIYTGSSSIMIEPLDRQVGIPQPDIHRHLIYNDITIRQAGIPQPYIHRHLIYNVITIRQADSWQISSKYTQAPWLYVIWEQLCTATVTRSMS